MKKDRHLVEKAVLAFTLFVVLALIGLIVAVMLLLRSWEHSPEDSKYDVGHINDPYGYFNWEGIPIFTPRWTPDGTQIIFSGGHHTVGNIYVAETDGSRIELILGDGDPHTILDDNYSPDISPDGTQLVYTTSRHHWNEQGILLMVYRTTLNIDVSSLDGTDRRRLTPEFDLDYRAPLSKLPAWSPDGTRIAFMEYMIRDKGLYVMKADGSELREVVKFGGSTEGFVGAGDQVWVLFAVEELKWSPDGEYIAYTLADIARPPKGETTTQRRRSIYVARVDGSRTSLVVAVPENGELTSPSWSPDGQRLAFAITGRASLEEQGIYTIGADGADRRLVTIFPGVTQVEWSSDGTDILFAADGAYLVGSNGSELRRVGPSIRQLAEAAIDGRGQSENVREILAYIHDRTWVSWSPDASQIAIYYQFVNRPYIQTLSDSRNGRLPTLDAFLLTVGSDGTDWRLLAESTEEGFPYPQDISFLAEEKELPPVPQEIGATRGPFD